jgi:magnesium and cobalt transporter
MSDPYPAADTSTDSAKASPPRLIDRLMSLVRREPEDREGFMAVLDAARARNLSDSDSYSML